MYNQIYLAAFIERLNTYQLIYSKSFLILYKEDWFTELGELLMEEISLNISLIPSKDDFQYLETVKNSIIKNIVYNEKSFFLNNWIEKFDLSKYNFPFVENKEVEQFLATSVSQDNLDHDKKKIATYMQIDFYCYVAMMEVQKMIIFIDNVLLEKNSFIGNNIETNKKVEDLKYKSIIWFKFGLLCAEGKLNKYYNKNKTSFKVGLSALKVAKDLGNEKYEKNILATVNNYPKDNSNEVKNIYNSRDKMDKIIKHCEDNNIIVDDYFMSRLPPE